MTHRIFTYGTLVIPRVMQAVTGQLPDAEDAVLAGWRRHRLRDRSYPGLSRSEQHRTAGRLYSGIDDATLARLDAFEGELYERRRVSVERVRDAAPLEAFVWVSANLALPLLLEAEWDPRAFSERDVEAFLARSR